MYADANWSFCVWSLHQSGRKSSAVHVGRRNDDVADDFRLRIEPVDVQAEVLGPGDGPVAGAELHGQHDAFR